MGDGPGLNATVIRSKLLSLTVNRNTDCRRQNLLHACGTDTLAPARHRAGVNRQAVLKKIKTAEIRPVGVLDPPLHNLIRSYMCFRSCSPTIKRVGFAGRRPVVLAKGIVECGPGHQVAQAYQIMFLVDDRIKAFAKEVGGVASWAS